MDIESVTEAYDNVATRLMLQLLGRGPYNTLCSDLRSIKSKDVPGWPSAGQFVMECKTWLDRSGFRAVATADPDYSAFVWFHGDAPLFHGFTSAEWSSDVRDLDKKSALQLYKLLWSAGSGMIEVPDLCAAHKLAAFFLLKGFASVVRQQDDISHPLSSTTNVSSTNVVIVSMFDLDGCPKPLTQRRHKVGELLADFLPRNVIVFCVLPYVGRV